MLYPQDSEAGLVAFLCAGVALKHLALGWICRQRKKQFKRVGTVSALYAYPIKSCGANSLQTARCTQHGLEDNGIIDRHWMVVDVSEGNKVMTMKQLPRLSLVTTTPHGDTIQINFPEMPTLTVAKTLNTKTAKLIKCKFGKKMVDAVDCGTEASVWLRRCLEAGALRLVFSSPDVEKRDAFNAAFKWENHARPGDTTAFAYLTSYLLTSTASLRNLEQRIEAPVNMVRFRPNIVIDGPPSYDEDDWKAVKIGEHTLLHCVQPCRRCAITTIDPHTAEKNEAKQPLEELKSFRCVEPYGKSPLFGQYCALDVSGIVSVGDPVYVLKNY